MDTQVNTNRASTQTGQYSHYYMSTYIHTVTNENKAKKPNERNTNSTFPRVSYNNIKRPS